MAATAEQVRRLRRIINDATAATYEDSALREYIERYPLMDGLGREPYIEEDDALILNDEWDATYDLNAAAADLWAEKAAALATEFDFSAGGQSFQRSQAYQMCMQQSRYYRARRAMKTVRAWPAPRPEEDPEEDLSN